MGAVWHFLVHWAGCDYGAGYGQFQPYDFLSGFASLSFLAGLTGLYRKHNCHEVRCWRIGRHVVDGTPYCDRHHEAARTGARGRGDG